MPLTLKSISIVALALAGIAMALTIGLNTHLQALLLANITYGTALLAAVLAPSWLFSNWDYFSEGRPFLFFALLFAAYTLFFLAAGDPDILRVLFSLFQGHISPLYQSRFVFSVLAISGLAVSFYHGGFLLLGDKINAQHPLRFSSATLLFMCYIALAHNSIGRLFFRV